MGIIADGRKREQEKKAIEKEKKRIEQEAIDERGRDSEERAKKFYDGLMTEADILKKAGIIVSLEGNRVNISHGDDLIEEVWFGWEAETEWVGSMDLELVFTGNYLRSSNLNEHDLAEKLLKYTG